MNFREFIQKINEQSVDDAHYKIKIENTFSWQTDYYDEHSTGYQLYKDKTAIAHIEEDFSFVGEESTFTIGRVIIFGACIWQDVKLIEDVLSKKMTDTEHGII